MKLPDAIRKEDPHDLIELVSKYFKIIDLVSRQQWRPEAAVSGLLPIQIQ
jgi:hypothetical protein